MVVLLLCLNVITAALFVIAFRHVKRLRRDRNDTRGLFGALPFVALEELHPNFQRSELGPTLASEIFFLSAGDRDVPGGASDFESAILATLAKSAKTMFEFGTCTGRTTYLWARNSPPDARVITITLHPDNVAAYNADVSDEREAGAIAVKESAFTKFYYAGTDVEKKVTQLFGDSKATDFSAFAGRCDLIFVDGSHAYSYVKSDSENALRMVAPHGLILWHDYRGPRSETKDVFRYLTELSATHQLWRIKGTSFVVYRP